MTADVEDLAGELEAANDEAIAFVQSCGDGPWTTMVEGEGWTVGVVLHHIAPGHGQMVDWIGHVRRGHDIAKTASEIDADNAGHALEFADVDRGTTRDELRIEGAALAALIRGLSADELVTTAAFGPGNGMEVTVEQLAPVAVRHCRTHLADARRALESGAPPHK
ncbi:MAG TPA: DinB family protein [Acidimicrobiales bacterium]